MASRWEQYRLRVMNGVVFVDCVLLGQLQEILLLYIVDFMEFLIASDIHGDGKSAEKLKEIYTYGNFDAFLLLGDLLYHGPRNDLPADYAPKSVISTLSGLSDSIISVRGNCEAEVDQMVLPFPVLSETALIFADGMKIMMTHGHSITPEKAPKSIDCFFSGHTHIPVLEKRDGIIYLNPGSVSIPKGGFNPSYALWIDGSIYIKELWTDTILFSLERKV